ncbi:hypothetical protein SMJ63A_10058 [Stenotrophomonas geniculata]
MGASTFFNVVETSTAVPLLLQIHAERVLQRVIHRNDRSHTYKKKATWGTRWLLSWWAVKDSNLGPID